MPSVALRGCRTHGLGVWVYRGLMEGAGFAGFRSEGLGLRLIGFLGFRA